MFYESFYNTHCINLIIFFLVDDFSFDIIILLLILITFNTLISGSRSYYFILDNDRVIVRNYLWFWIDKTFYIKDIKSINGGKTSKYMAGVEINTSISSQYFGFHLSKEEYFIMFKFIKDKGVEVNDYLYKEKF